MWWIGSIGKLTKTTVFLCYHKISPKLLRSVWRFRLCTFSVFYCQPMLPLWIATQRHISYDYYRHPVSDLLFWRGICSINDDHAASSGRFRAAAVSFIEAGDEGRIRSTIVYPSDHKMSVLSNSPVLHYGPWLNLNVHFRRELLMYVAGCDLIELTVQ